MLNLPRPLIRRVEMKELSGVSRRAGAVSRRCPEELLNIYIRYSCDIAGRWDDCDVLVAENADGRIAGTVSYAAPSRRGDDDLSAGWATLRSLMVHPDMRGQATVGVWSSIASRRPETIAHNDRPSYRGLHGAARHVYRLAGFIQCPAHVLASTMMGFSPDADDVALLTYNLDLSSGPHPCK